MFAGITVKQILNRFVNKSRSFSFRSAAPRSSHVHCAGRNPLVYRNIGQELERAVNKFGSREAIVSCHEGQRETFATIQDKVDKLSASLLKLGLNPGDAVGIWAPNNIHWYLSFLAATKVGLVSVGINPAFQAPEVKYCLKKVNVKAIIAAETFKTQKYYEILNEIIPEVAYSEPGNIKSQQVPSLRSIIIDSEQSLPGAYRFNDLVDLANSSDVNGIKKKLDDVDPDSPCNIQFTSGTTGHPKATVLSHFGFVNNGIQIGNRNELSMQHQRICTQVPLFHAYGVVISIMAAMSHGATLVLPAAGFSPEASLRAIVDEKCTVIHGTPTMYVDLIAKQRELQLPLETAEIGITGGSPCTPRLFKEIREVLGLKKVKTVYGLTETTAVIFQSLTEETDEHVLQTVGHIQDHVEAKVVDSDGKVVPFGKPGELCIRGYMNMLEYYGDEEKTKETIGKDRWLRTGDQFVLHENGYGRIVGRLKEMIIRGGENIFPKEVEDFLTNHPDILEAYVIGIEDERLGEEICAFVRLKKDADTLTQSQVKDFCKGKLAHFKVPKYVHVVNDFPKTISGKIQKFKLKDIFNKLHNK